MGYWWCKHCEEEVHGSRVTNQEHHDSCGWVVEWIDDDAVPVVETLKAQLSAAQAERDGLKEQLTACREAMKKVRSFLVAPHEARWDYPFHSQVRLAYDTADAAIAATEEET